MIDFGICDSPVLDNSPELVDICTGGSLTLQDMAGAAIYLASRAGDYVMGGAVTVDGGVSFAR